MGDAREGGEPGIHTFDSKSGDRGGAPFKIGRVGGKRESTLYINRNQKEWIEKVFDC
jgi:hypothetical protein